MTDFRYVLRTFRRSPMFALSAILALALGIGANTAVFSVVYAVLLKPLPYSQPDRLLKLAEWNPAEGVAGDDVSVGTFVDWRTRSHSLQALAVYTVPANGQTLWESGDHFEAVRSSGASPALFPVLGVSPILGRTFRPELQQDRPSGDHGQLVISYRLWQRMFGGAPDVVGRTVTVEGRSKGEIIGVMPRGFSFPEGTDAWANLSFVDPPRNRRALSYRTIARMAPGISIEDVRTELAGVSAQIAVEHPESNAGWTPHVVPLAGSDTASARPALLALLGAVTAVLLIGCANVANLLLARASARQREFAVRMALGATATRLIRQSLADALVLSALGAAAGLVAGEWLTRALVGLAPPDIPRLGDVGMSGAVLLFAGASTLMTAILIGLAPALHVARGEREGALRSESRAATAHGASVRRLLIGGEVAAVVLLLTGALLLVRTFVSLRGVDLGFQPARAVEVSTRWPIGRIFPSTRGVRPWPRIQRAIDGLTAAVGGIPGVEAVGMITDVPLTGNSFSGVVWRADAPGASGLTPPADSRDRWRADLSVVTPGYFSAMGVPILRGRNFAEQDRLTDEQLNASTAPTSGVVVINDAFARKYFPDRDPVGRTIIVADDQTFGWTRTVIGVVGDIRGHAVAQVAAPALYVPHAQHPDVFVPTLIVRSSLPYGVVAAAIRDRIRAYDPQLLVQRIQPLDAIVSNALARPRFNLLLIASFALTALLLAAVGIYGVVAFLVGQRTREIGIRMALGARAADVAGLVMKEGMSPVLLGGLAGLTASAAATRTLKSLLFGVTPLDPVSFAAAPAILTVVALIACYLPARRAMRVDPLVALRDE